VRFIREKNIILFAPRAVDGSYKSLLMFFENVNLKRHKYLFPYKPYVLKGTLMFNMLE